MRRAALILAALSVLALLVTVIGGARHDYIYYLQQWQLVLDHADPWSGNNAYGPLHNAFALLLPLHPLAPKLLNAACLLAANALLVVALLRARPFAEWRTTYLVAFAANLLVLVSAFWFGLNDAFVAALLIGAVLARRDDRLLLAGLLLGLATLDKYYPALLIPFFALDARVVQPRLILSAILTIAVGIGVAVWLWGSAWLEAVTYGVSRDATILSILRPITVLGRHFGAGDAVDLLVRFDGPLVLLVWLGALAVAWLRRENWLIGACSGFLAVLLAYKVGNPQFWVSWLAIIACLPLLRLPAADRLARLAWPTAIFLSVFEFGYVVLQPEYYQGALHWIVDSVGVVSFALGLWLLVAYLRPASRRPS